MKQFNKRNGLWGDDPSESLCSDNTAHEIIIWLHVGGSHSYSEGGFQQEGIWIN